MRPHAAPWWAGLCSAAMLAPVACAGPSPPVPPRAPPSTVVAIAKSAPTVPACEGAFAAAAESDRALAVDALISGRTAVAAAAAKRLVGARPSDSAAEALHQATEAALIKARVRADDVLSKTPSTLLERMPLAPRAAASPPSAPPVRLVLESEKRNLITDTGDWLERNGLESPTLHQLASAPDHVASHYLEHPFRALFRPARGDHRVALYGHGFLVVSAAGQAPRAFDARQVVESGASRPFEVRFAEMIDRKLIVSVAYNGYAKESGGKNGYVAAFDVDSGTLAWSSSPLVSNAWGFFVSARHVVAGYGFTAEPDHLHVLDLATGGVVETLSLKSGPEWILERAGKIFVRTYDVDYVFRLEGSAEPAPPPALRPRGVSAQAGTEADRRCWTLHGLAAIDKKSEVELGHAIAALGASRDDAPIVDAFRAASARLSRRGGALDLTAVAPIAVAPPPWSYAFVAPAKEAPPSSPPRLVRVASRPADPARVLDRKKPSRPFAPMFIAPVDEGALPPGARGDIPSRYGNETLRAIVPSGDRTLLVYGGRTLASVTGDAVERIFDLTALTRPPKANPQWQELSIQDITFAQVDGGVVYVCNGGGSYAKEVFGKKAFLSALDFTTGKLLWRSEPLVCGGTFALYGDYLVTGYGFTGEPDHVSLVRLRDGKVMQKVAVESAPHGFELDGGRILVDAYDKEYVFELKTR